MFERSPTTTPSASGSFARVSLARFSFRAWRSTWWPSCKINLAAMRPRPSDEPVMNTRAMLLLIFPAHYQEQFLRDDWIRERQTAYSAMLWMRDRSGFTLENPFMDAAAPEAARLAMRLRQKAEN